MLGMQNKEGGEISFHLVFTTPKSHVVSLHKMAHGFSFYFFFKRVEWFLLNKVEEDCSR